MSALNFKAEFEAPILAGTKILTLRKPRVDDRDPAPVGLPLKLYTGMRRPGCRLILATESVFRCGLQFGERIVVSVLAETMGSAYAPQADLFEAFCRETQDQQPLLNRLARMDGFPSWEALWAFHSAEGPLDDIGCVYREVIGWARPGGSA